MKVIDVLERLNTYEYVHIHASLEADWNEENPYTLVPAKVKDLGWLFVQCVSGRDVVEIASSAVGEDSIKDTCVVIVYR